jgi:CBS domain
VSTTVAAAAQKMRDEDVGCLLVGRNDRVFEIVTDRDVVVRALVSGKNPTREPVRNVMSSAIVCCFEDQLVEEAATIMKEQGVRRLPVLDRQKRLTGIVSLSDLHGGASRKKPYAVTFFKELADSCGTLQEVPLRTVYVAAVASEEDAVAAATTILENDWAQNRWTGMADGCKVDRGRQTRPASPAAVSARADMAAGRQEPR